MLFNSWQFILLVAVTATLYFLPAMQRVQRLILVIASFIFYGAHHPWLLLLLVGSITTNTAFTGLLAKGKYSAGRITLITGVAINLATLAFFKYSGLLAESLLKSFHTGELAEILTAIPLPVGISFFTFQGISLLVDTQRAKVNRELAILVSDRHAGNWMDVALFISFFPQLVAGPIVKAHDFLPQIRPKFIRDVDWTFVFRTLVTGYFLKMVVADNLKTYTAWVEFPVFHTKSTLTLATMLFGYSMQIFSDFAGYSLIAIGVAAVFGYRLIANFNFPYIASSFSEFWQRWHISLSSFLKEYLYIPLGGNRNGQIRTYRNLMITMLLGGLWHGAAWSYAVWGFAHGVALCAERWLRGTATNTRSAFSRVAGAGFVFTYVTLAWLLFKLPEFSHVIEFFQALAANLRIRHDYGMIIKIALYSLPVVAYHVRYLMGEQMRASFRHVTEPIVFGLMLFLIVTNSGRSAEFIYFQF
jgi:alginate O-acetyltransferase complex protein AlgI